MRRKCIHPAKNTDEKTNRHKDKQTNARLKTDAQINKSFAVRTRNKKLGKKCLDFLMETVQQKLFFSEK